MKIPYRQRPIEPAAASADASGSNRRDWLLRAAAGFSGIGVLGASLSGCGGGGGPIAEGQAPLAAPPDVQPLGGVDSGGTGKRAMAFFSVDFTATAPLTGGDVQFDTSVSEVVDADGVLLAANGIERGMTGELETTRVRSIGGTAQAQALRIRLREQLIGPMVTRDDLTNRLVVLGQRVDVTSTTVVDPALGGALASIQPGQLVRVWGQLDTAQGRIVASRLDAPPALSALVLRGVLTELDAASGRAVVGGVTLQAAQGSVLDGDMVVGQVARARIDAATGVLLALRRDELVLPERDFAAIEGRVTAFTSSRRFDVDGIPVDAGGSDAKGLSLVELGARVQVQGRVRNGMLQASQVQVESDEGDALGELEGTITAVNAVARTFVMRGVTVRWSDDTTFETGGADDLRPRRKAAVRGRLSADRRRMEAVRIHLEM